MERILKLNVFQKKNARFRVTLVDEPEDVEGDGGGRGRVEDHRRRRRGRDRRRDAHLNLGFVLRACTTRGGEEVFQPTLLFIQLFSISVSGNSGLPAVSSGNASWLKSFLITVVAFLVSISIVSPTLAGKYA